MVAMPGRIRHYKVSALPDTLLPDCFYWVLKGDGSVEGFLTDTAGVARKIENDEVNIDFDELYDPGDLTLTFLNGLV
jgi:hypothetical protein